jgi:hypothetical protein
MIFRHKSPKRRQWQNDFVAKDVAEIKALVGPGYYAVPPRSELEYLDERFPIFVPNLILLSFQSFV